MYLMSKQNKVLVERYIDLGMMQQLGILPAGDLWSQGKELTK